jgi:hypothetical protein
MEALPEGLMGGLEALQLLAKAQRREQTALRGAIPRQDYMQGLAEEAEA